MANGITFFFISSGEWSTCHDEFRPLDAFVRFNSLADSHSSLWRLDSKKNVVQ